MELASKLAAIGNRILAFLASLIIILMLLYGGYSLWDVYVTYTGAFLGSDLMQWKPAAGEDNAPTFEELRAINPDVKAWITIDDTHIDYPVLQGEDDMEYVNKDVYGEFSLSGAIFISAENDGDFNDKYSLTYGHHMDNGGMYGDVMEMLDEAYFRKHQTGTLILPDKTYQIQLYAIVETDAYDSMIYNVQNINNDMSAFQSYIREKALYYEDIGVTAEDQVVSLSTCKDTSTSGRAVAIGKLVPLSANKEEAK